MFKLFYKQLRRHIFILNPCCSNSHWQNVRYFIFNHKPDIVHSTSSQIISLILSCTWHIVDLDTSQDVLKFLEQFQDVLPKSDHYLFIMNSYNIFYKQELLNFFSHNFFRKVVLKNWLNKLGLNWTKLSSSWDLEVKTIFFLFFILP